MRGDLIEVLACPDCGGHPLQSDATGESIQRAHLTCPSGHTIEVREGVLWALRPTPDITGQLAENARERRGDLTTEEKDAYRRNVSRIGSATYNELIRDNARAVLDDLETPPGRSLDLGGGSGWLAAELAKRGFWAVSLDIQSPAERRHQVEAGAARRDFELVTDLAPELDHVTVDFVVADMHRVPFVDGAFDLVSLSAALHHASDPVATLQQARRLLRPGGAVICINEPVKGLFRDKENLHGHASGVGEHLYSARAYLGFFRKAGLQPRLYFPGWVDRRLRERDWESIVYFRWLLPLAGRLWSMPPVRRLSRGPLFRIGMDLFGLTLIAVGRKN